MTEENYSFLNVIMKMTAPEQTNNKYIKIYELEYSRHKILSQILQLTNNMNLVRTSWQECDNHNMTEVEWGTQLAALNWKLIKLGIIIPDVEIGITNDGNV